MTRMNHAGLVESVAVDGVAAALRAGEGARVAGLGTFAVAARAARQGRDPRTGAPVRVGASEAVRFRAAKAAREAVNAAAPGRGAGGPGPRARPPSGP